MRKSVLIVFGIFIVLLAVVDSNLVHAFVCSSNSDCGEDGWIEDVICKKENVYQEYQNFACLNPGTIKAKCKVKAKLMLKETCEFGCYNGKCKSFNKQISWLKAHQFSSGLIESQVGWQDHRSFTYDQALAIVALTHHGDIIEAKKVLNAMKSLQNEDGSWYDAYYSNTKYPWEWGKSTGNTAWMVIAMNYYQEQTADNSYSGSAEKALAWLKKRINKQSPNCFGALNLGENFWNIPNPQDIFSTEHNLDAYSAFKNRIKFTTDENKKAEYSQIVSSTENFLVNEIWNPNSKVFIRGCNKNGKDYELWLDAQTWGYMVLGESYKSSLDYALLHMTNTLSWEGQNVNGFQYNNYNSNSIWLEGTAQMIDALFLSERNDLAGDYRNEISKVEQEDGGIPYSFNSVGGAIAWPDNLRYPSISPVAWTYFADNKINPFI